MTWGQQDIVSLRGPCCRSFPHFRPIKSSCRRDDGSHFLTSVPCPQCVGTSYPERKVSLQSRERERSEMCWRFKDHDRRQMLQRGASLGLAWSCTKHATAGSWSRSDSARKNDPPTTTQLNRPKFESEKTELKKSKGLNQRLWAAELELQLFPGPPRPYVRCHSILLRRCSIFFPLATWYYPPLLHF